MARDIVYIDVDDEITGVVNKVEACKGKVVALVPPKHAAVLSSTINLKLLKKAADSSKKSLVLITADPNIITLAASAQLHIAKSLKSKPITPPSPKKEHETAVISSEDLEELSPESVNTTSENDDVIHLDNTVKISKKAPMGAINKKLKVPNFSSFRLKLFLSIFAAVFLIVGGIYAMVVMPRAKIILKTEVSSIDSTLQLTINSGIKDFDPKNPVLPGTIAEKKKNDSEKVPATGKKDMGTKATGSMTIYNCTDSDVSVPAGSIFTNSGYSFALDETVTVPASDFFSNGTCKKNKSKVSSVTALLAGGNSNLSAGRDYTSNIATTLTAVGGAMGGGTSKIVTVISNDDIESAKAKLTGKSKSEALAELTNQLQESTLIPISETFTESAPTFTTSAAVDTEAADVTVSAVTNYTMLGVIAGDVKQLVEDSVSGKISDSRQKILNNGLDKKVVQVLEKKSATEQKISLAVVAIVGPDINTEGIATEFAGKTRGEIQNKLSQRAGIKDVTVTYSPFWVASTPKKASKITVSIEQVNAGQQ